MKQSQRFSRFLLESPWTLGLFFLIPLLVILSIKFRVPVPFVRSTWPLLVNNIIAAGIVLLRLVRYVCLLGRSLRYGSGSGRPRTVVPVSRTGNELRSSLADAGYFFASDGSYAERRDGGYVGTTVIYAGLAILLSVGVWDNLRQFSGVLLDGIGPATSLNRLESYRHVQRGPLAKLPVNLPRMQIINQFMPDATYPMGATEIALTDEDGKTQKTIIKPRDPVHLGAFNLYMAKIVFEPQLVIKTKDRQLLFDSFVRLDQLVQKRGNFSFYGLFLNSLVHGGIYYQPEKSLMKVVITRGEEKTVTDLTFQVDQQVEQGNYILSCAKMGQWSEIHVVRRRHTSLIWLGGVIALIGLIMRLAIRPQRVWIEDAPDGSRVAVVGAETKKLLGISG